MLLPVVAESCLPSLPSCRMKGLGKVQELGLLGSTSSELATYILTFLHGLTYLPLILLAALQDAHLKLVAVLNTSLLLCLIAGNWLFHYLGIVKVGKAGAAVPLLLCWCWCWGGGPSGLNASPGCGCPADALLQCAE